MSNIPPTRILAVEVRSARFGYALLAKPQRLLDYGAAWFDSPIVARLRIRRLLEISHPTLLVLRKKLRRETARAKSTASIIRKEAKKHSIPISSLTERTFKAYYDSHSCHTKYEIASFLAALLPEIAWRTPPQRKFYEPEPLSMIYFDSTALAIAHLELEN